MKPAEKAAFQWYYRGGLTRAFSDAGAVSPETAIAPPEAPGPVPYVQWGIPETFDTLLDRGIIRHAGQGRYYFDEQKQTADRRGKRRVVIPLLVLGLLWLLFLMSKL